MCSLPAPPSPFHPTQSSVRLSCNPSAHHHISLSCDQSICHPSVCQLTHPHIELSVCHMDTSICHTTHQSICQSPHKSVALSVCTLASPSVIPIHLSYDQSIQHPINSSMTHQSVTPPISPVLCPSDHPSLSNCLYNILPCPSDRTSLPDHLYDKPLSLSNHLSLPDRLYNQPPSLSACLSLSDSLTATMTHPTICPSSHMIHHTQDSSQSLAVVNGSNPARPRNSVGPLLTTTYFYVP